MYALEAGARGTSRAIKNLALIKKFLGDATFMELASVKLGDLDKYLNPQQLAMVLETSRGARAIKFTRRSDATA